MTPATAPAFVRAPKTEAQTTFYVAIAHMPSGPWSIDIDGCTCATTAAQIAAEAMEATNDPGLEVWHCFTVYELPSGKDVTGDAIRVLVALYRKTVKGSTFPAWWQEHDSTLAEHELDTWEPEASGQEMRDYWREHGRKDD